MHRTRAVPAVCMSAIRSGSQRDDGRLAHGGRQDALSYEYNVRRRASGDSRSLGVTVEAELGVLGSSRPCRRQGDGTAPRHHDREHCSRPRPGRRLRAEDPVRRRRSRSALARRLQFTRKPTGDISPPAHQGNPRAHPEHAPRMHGSSSVPQEWSSLRKHGGQMKETTACRSRRSSRASGRRAQGQIDTDIRLA